MAPFIFKLLPKSITKKDWYQNYVLPWLDLYSFVASIVALVLFVVYLISLGSTLTTAHGVVLAIAICCAVYTTITTAVICCVKGGRYIVNVVKLILSTLFFFAWIAVTAILATESGSCGGGDKKRKRNDSDDNHGSCGVWTGLIVVSVMNAIGFLLTALLANTADVRKMKRPPGMRKKEATTEPAQPEATTEPAQTGRYEPVVYA